VILGENAASGTCGSKTGVSQKFKISFTTNADDTMMEQKKSGNPGYLDGYPLKIGFVDAANEEAGSPVNVYQDGFEISGTDNAGKCMRVAAANTADSVTDYQDPIVNFRQDLTYGCSIPYNKDTLKAMCESGTVEYTKGFQLFKNIDEQFKVYGKFGNANLFFSKDWSKVTEDPSYAKFGEATWNAETETCEVYSSILIKVITETMGFSENP